MTRTREWTKFGLLVLATIGLAAAFATALNRPTTSHAQQRGPVVFQTAPPPAIPAAQPATDLGEAFAAVAEAVRPAVVFIQSETEATARGLSPFANPFNDDDPDIRMGQGSGFIISPDGYIITNDHVVRDASRITVRLLDRRSFEAEMVGHDPTTDIAVIKIDATDLTPISLGTSQNVRIGEWVLAIGNPLGQEFSFTVTAGIVSGRGRRLVGLRQGQGEYSIHDFIQTDAAINPGNSGGPLVNIHGQVIGVNSAIASRTGTYTGYGFAVPIDLAKTVSQQIIEDGRVTRAVLGVSINDATPEDAEYVGLDSIFGVRVEQFPADDSPAKRAGIRPGDIIIAVDGKPALYTAQLQQDIGFRRPGETVDVTVARRDGERHTYAVTLEAAQTDQLEQIAAADDAPERREDNARYESKLGLALQPLTSSELMEEYRVSRRVAQAIEGMRIVRVDPRGPARDNRLPVGWVITHVNGERVRTQGELSAVLASVDSGDIVSLETAALDRSGGLQSRIVRLRSGSEQ